MNSNLNNIMHEALNSLKQVQSLQQLDVVKAEYLGKNGKISQQMQQLKTLAADEKKQFGQQINQLKLEFEQQLSERKQQILNQQLQTKLAQESIDVSLDGKNNHAGSLHPIYLTLNRMLHIFAALGFDVGDGPEIESDYYNFNALNIPANHPARAMQDTFYIDATHVLRTHTSPIQIRYAEQKTPPIKLIAPGRVYRVDMDATHSPMFHQIEGLWIDENITFANLKGIIIEFLRRFFANEQLQIRFRASFFPFTEPSAEVDILSSDGKWLEVLGCGMVHPTVLENMNIDSARYNGFAFGMGIDRFTMLKYGIHDLRLMFENDIDFIRQFRGMNEVK